MEDIVQYMFSPCSFPAGINLATIKDIKRVRLPSGQVKTKEGSISLMATFENGEMEGGIEAYVNSKSQWIWDKLCKAANVDNIERQPSVEELKGKQVYLSTIAVFNIVNGEISEEPDFTYLEPKFYPVGGIKPIIEKDPQRTGKYEEGPFVVYRNVEDQ